MQKLALMLVTLILTMAWAGHGAMATMAFDQTIIMSRPSADVTLEQRFNHLNTNGNSNCSSAFLQSIPDMDPSARLQGSCCSAMDLHRYSEQIEGLRRYAVIATIPPDPYDIEAGRAQALLEANDIVLAPTEQKAFDDALTLADEGGPCCCRCWRWEVYSGLGKLLIHNLRLTGEEMAKVWDLSSGCGGAHAH